MLIASLSFPSQLIKTTDFTQHQLWRGRRRPGGELLKRHGKKVVPVSQQLGPLSISSSTAHLLHQYHFHPHNNPSSSLLFLLDSVQGYSLTSYYTSLGLFVISVPGLWSLIKRSVKSKVFSSPYLFSLPPPSVCVSFSESIFCRLFKRHLSSARTEKGRRLQIKWLEKYYLSSLETILWWQTEERS